MPNFFDKECAFMNVCDLLGKLADLLETRIKTKKIHCVLEFNQSQ